MKKTLIAILLCFAFFEATSQTLVASIRVVSVNGQDHDVVGVYNGDLTPPISVGDTVLARVNNDCVTGTITSVASVDTTTRTFSATISAPKQLNNSMVIIYRGIISDIPANTPTALVGCMVSSLLNAAVKLSGGLKSSVGGINHAYSLGLPSPIVADAFKVHNGYLYLTTQNADSISIYSFHDPSAPYFIKSFPRDTNTNTTILIANNRLYTTTEVFDITDPLNPVRLCHNPGGGNTQDNPKLPVLGYAIWGNWVYGVDNLWQMRRYNLETCQDELIWEASDGNYWQEDEVIIKDGILYTALNDNNEHLDELMAWKLNPNGTVDSLTGINLRYGGAWPNNNIGDIKDNILFYSFDKSNPDEDSILIFDITDLRNPVQLAAIPSSSSFDFTKLTESDLVARGDDLYEAHKQGLTVYDVSDPSNPVVKLTIPNTEGFNNLYFYKDYLLASSPYEDSLHIFKLDIQYQESSVEDVSTSESFYGHVGGFGSVYLNDGYVKNNLFVGEGVAGVYIDRYAEFPGGANEVNFRRYRGTPTNKKATIEGDVIGGLNFFGFNGTSDRMIMNVFAQEYAHSATDTSAVLLIQGYNKVQGGNLPIASFSVDGVKISLNEGSILDIDESAALEISTTTKGFLPPRMTQAQRDAISTPAAGLTIFCTDCTANDASTGVLQTFNGTTWKNHW